MDDSYRITHDTLGEVRVPADAYYGAQTQRAVDNFPISGLQLPRAFIRAQGIIKWAAARANRDAGALSQARAEAIMTAADEVIEGRWDDHFVVDVFQAGAGTSQNMNANEIIANRACELMGGELGKLDPVHPNDHVNMAQSTNDTIHVAMHLAAFETAQRLLMTALEHLEEALNQKAAAFDGIVKAGRTHLQDAVPMRLGQEFSAFAAVVRQGRRRVHWGAEPLREIGIGGTALGTGLNAAAGYAEGALAGINERTDMEFRLPDNRFEFMQNTDAVVEFHGQLRALAVGLTKIANDLRLLSSGPRTGLAEIELPPVQPGSSIMPGKVNPVMAEMLNMVAYQVMGNDAAVAAAGQAGQLQLNVMMPMMAHNVLQSVEILARGCEAFSERCVKGIEANEERCRQYVEESLAMATALNPVIGYEAAAAIAYRAHREGRTVREVALEAEVAAAEELDAMLDAYRMTQSPEEGATDG